LNNLSQKALSNWQNQVITSLNNDGIDFVLLSEDQFVLISIPNYALVLNLIHIENEFNPDSLILLQNKYQLQELKLIHLWEDVWLSRSEQVLARIKSLSGLNIRLHGRKTKIQKITKPVSDLFLKENHMQGAVSSRYKFGLFFKDDLVAVATFSALRKMNYSDNYRSAELIRFAVKSGYSVSGGLSKLISNFQTEIKSNDLMTYADRDWSAGEAYLKLGFTQTSILAPQYFTLDNNLKRNLEKANFTDNRRVFNTGSLKYILKF
jgi:hypothetical protein